MQQGCGPPVPVHMNALQEAHPKKECTVWGPGSQNEAKKPPKRFKNSTSQPSWGPENTPRAPQKGPQRPPRGHQIGQKTTKRPQYQHKCGPEALLGPLGAVLGPSWGCLGAILGPSWGHLGASGAHLGAILGPARCFLGPFSALLGPSWLMLLRS